MNYEEKATIPYSKELFLPLLELLFPFNLGGFSMYSKRPPADVTEKFVYMSIPFNYKPTNLDVINGRGKAFWNHSGNVAFRNVIQSRTDDYVAAKGKKRKTAIVNGIVEELRLRGCKFLKQEIDQRGHTYWQDIGDEAVREKVGHSLRDQVISSNRPDRVNVQSDHNQIKIHDKNAQNSKNSKRDSDTTTEAERNAASYPTSGNKLKQTFFFDENEVTLYTGASGTDTTIRVRFSPQKVPRVVVDSTGSDVTVKLYSAYRRGDHLQRPASLPLRRQLPVATSNASGTNSASTSSLQFSTNAIPEDFVSHLSSNLFGHDAQDTKVFLERCLQSLQDESMNDDGQMNSMMGHSVDKGEASQMSFDNRDKPSPNQESQDKTRSESLPRALMNDDVEMMDSIQGHSVHEGKATGTEIPSDNNEIPSPNHETQDKTRSESLKEEAINDDDGEMMHSTKGNLGQEGEASRTSNDNNQESSPKHDKIGAKSLHHESITDDGEMVDSIRDNLLQEGYSTGSPTSYNHNNEPLLNQEIHDKIGSESLQHELMNDDGETMDSMQDHLVLEGKAGQASQASTDIPSVNQETEGETRIESLQHEPINDDVQMMGSMNDHLVHELKASKMAYDNSYIPSPSRETHDTIRSDHGGSTELLKQEEVDGDKFHDAIEIMEGSEVGALKSEHFGPQQIDTEYTGDALQLN